MSIPYLGSKRKSCNKIYEAIVSTSPKFNTFVDLFCGGFAVGEVFLQKGYKVVANDKNKCVIALLRKTIIEGLDKDKLYEFITREKFFDIQKNPDNYEDWYVGVAQCCWSFGNNQRCYLFAKSKVEKKHAFHDLVVHKDTIKASKYLTKEEMAQILELPTVKERRLKLGRLSKYILSGGRVRNFELEQLERLQQLERLELYSDSYENIVIPKNAVVYCDIPYKYVTEYKEGQFDHTKFWDWVREQSKHNLVFVSEYQAPDDFEVVLEFAQKSTLCGGTQKHSNQPTEKLYKIK